MIDIYFKYFIGKLILKMESRGYRPLHGTIKSCFS